MVDETKKNKKGLGEFFEGLNGLLELVSKIQEQGTDTLTRSGEFRSENGTAGVYGVQIKAVRGGTPIFEQFGNIGRQGGSAVVSDEREPLVDIFEEDNQVILVAEIPGASEESIKVEIVGQHLTLTATARDKRYKKELILPYETTGEPLKRSYTNGMFSMSLKRAIQTADKS
jgi:HSP20 family protein